MVSYYEFFRAVCREDSVLSGQNCSVWKVLSDRPQDAVPAHRKNPRTSFSKPGRNALKKVFLTKLTPVCYVLVCGFSMAEPESKLV
jgi:hypothetical protein